MNNDLSTLDITQTLKNIDFEITCGFDKCNNIADWNVTFDYECKCTDQDEYACESCHQHIVRYWDIEATFICNKCGVCIGYCSYSDIVLKMEKIK